MPNNKYICTVHQVQCNDVQHICDHAMLAAANKMRKLPRMYIFNMT